MESAVELILEPLSAGHVDIDLSREAHCFERLTTAAVASLGSNDEPIPNGQDRAIGASNLDAAGFAFANQAADHHYSIAGVDELILLGVHSFPYLVRVGQPLSKPVLPEVSLGVEHASSGIEHDLGMGEVNRFLAITAIQRTEDLWRDFYVLLRNTPSPALRMGDSIRRV
jgi:hypothetical protein